jgi:hypothetical protein
MVGRDNRGRDLNRNDRFRFRPVFGRCRCVGSLVAANRIEELAEVHRVLRRWCAGGVWKLSRGVTPALVCED